VTTHSKQEASTTAQKGVEHNSSRKYFQKNHKGSSWENKEKLSELEQRFG
jgi:hypothetical protein